MKKINKAFTLAEVLITLGIIGVVAAMTLPLLIQEYRKNVVENRLKQTYSQLSQVFKLAENEHGEMYNWVDELSTRINVSKSTSEMAPFINEYIMPYLSGAKFNEDKPPIRELGFTNGIKTPDGADFLPANAGVYSVQLPNGVILLFSAISGNVNNNDKIFIGLNIVACLKGGNKQATLGKDVFSFELNFNNSKLGTFNCQRYIVNSDNKLVCEIENDRDVILDKCSTGNSARMCSTLIQMDGWHILKDYPHKL